VVYCYVVRVGSYIKIGHSSNLNKRMEAINTHSPSKPKIVCLFSFETIYGARSCEKHLHSRLNKFRLNGEWFEADKTIQFLKSSGKVLFDDDIELPYGARAHMKSI
jgi:hypothetical protein